MNKYECSALQQRSENGYTRFQIVSRIQVSRPSLRVIRRVYVTHRIAPENRCARACTVCVYLAYLQTHCRQRRLASGTLRYKARLLLLVHVCMYIYMCVDTCVTCMVYNILSIQYRYTVVPCIL